MAIALVLSAPVAIVAAAATPAAASCVASPLAGDWCNINASTNAMTRVIVVTCQPVTTCSGGICQTTYDAGTFMTPFGKCSPTDCNWGRKQAEHMDSGWIRTIHAFGFKTSHVWARNYEYYGRTYLRLWVFNDFATSDNRTDYTTDEWFLR